MQSSINWFNRYNAQLYCTPSLVVFVNLIADLDTWFDLIFHNTQPTNSWMGNQRGLSSICTTLYARPPLVKLYFFVTCATNILSWSFPMKCVVGSAPILLKPMIWWIRSIIISTLRSNHRCPLCMQDNSTVTTVFTSLLCPKCGICSKFRSPDGYNKAIQACDVNASTFMAMLTVIAMYWSTWNYGNLIWSSKL